MEKHDQESAVAEGGRRATGGGRFSGGRKSAVVMCLLRGEDLERRFIISVAMIAGAVGALGAGLTSEAARWLCAAFLAVAGSGWATLAAWWSS